MEERRKGGVLVYKGELSDRFIHRSHWTAFKRPPEFSLQYEYAKLSVQETVKNISSVFIYISRVAPSAHCFLLVFIFDSCLLSSFVRLLIGLFGFSVVFQVLRPQCSVRSIASQATIPSCGLSVQPARARMTLSRKELATNAGREEQGISVHCGWGLNQSSYYGNQCESSQETKRTTVCPSCPMPGQPSEGLSISQQKDLHIGVSCCTVSSSRGIEISLHICGGVNRTGMTPKYLNVWSLERGTLGSVALEDVCLWGGGTLGFQKSQQGLVALFLPAI